MSIIIEDKLSQLYCCPPKCKNKKEDYEEYLMSLGNKFFLCGTVVCWTLRVFCTYYLVINQPNLEYIFQVPVSLFYYNFDTYFTVFYIFNYKVQNCILSNLFAYN